MLMQTNITYPISKSVRTALAGGFVGALIMGGLALVIPINGQPFFVATAMLMGLSGAMATAAGWMLHDRTLKSGYSKATTIAQRATALILEVSFNS